MWVESRLVRLSTPVVWPLRWPLHDLVSTSVDLSPFLCTVLICFSCVESFIFHASIIIGHTSFRIVEINPLWTESHYNNIYIGIWSLIHLLVYQYQSNISSISFWNTLKKCYLGNKNNKYLYSAFLWNNSKRCVTHTYKMNNFQTNNIEFRIQMKHTLKEIKT